ncbi:MAG: inner-membrane translocator [Gammaproteobacteria bacterium]|nr:inner-membrane translocator [Gammaproteobacteria bacterium]
MPTHDRQLQVYARFDARIRAQMKALVTPALIAEHAANPLGPHSDALARVLNYFRKQPLPGKYVIVASEPWREYRIGMLSGQRGVPAQIVGEDTWPTEAAALHGIFLRRVRALEHG